MKTNRIYLTGIFAALLLMAQLAAGQATRTWVSGVGDDANPCSRTAPCKTFAGAISKTAPGGEINVLDPGGFGAVTITKSITISSEGFEAGVLVSGTNGIIISALATDTVILRGLDIEGLGTGLAGIRVLGVGTLHIERCTINDFRGSQALGIDIEPTTAGNENIFIKDTIVRDNGTGVIGGGILIKPGAGVTVKASLDNVRIEGNVVGIRVRDNSTVTIKNSVAAGNSGTGFQALQTGGGPITLTLDHASATANAIGVESNGTASTIVQITNVTAAGNTTGLQATGGQIISFGSNNISGNGTNGAPTSNIGQQ